MGSFIYYSILPLSSEQLEILHKNSVKMPPHVCHYFCYNFFDSGRLKFFECCQMKIFRKFLMAEKTFIH